jgi:hypothetical protein
VTIAQSIRSAAINWPNEFLPDFECELVDVFQEQREWYWPLYLRSEDDVHHYQARVFLLLVAEALE